MFLYAASPCMNVLEVNIFNPTKLMQRMNFVQASRLNGAKYSWNKLWHEFISF